MKENVKRLFALEQREAFPAECRMPMGAGLADSARGAYPHPMPERTTIPTDFVSILAFIFGAAVIIPAMISLGVTLVAVADAIF